MDIEFVVAFQFQSTGKGKFGIIAENEMHILALHDDGLATHVSANHIVLGNGGAISAHSKPIFSMARHFLVLPLRGFDFIADFGACKSLQCADYLLVFGIPRPFDEIYRARGIQTSLILIV